MSSAIWREWGCLLVGLTLIVGGAVTSLLWRLPIRDTDKPDAVRKIAAWIVEDASIPGFGERYVSVGA